MEDLASQLKVEVTPKSENLRISYTDRNPALASTAVASIITAYQKIYTRDHLRLEEQRLQLLQDYRNSLTNQLAMTQAPPAKPAELEVQAPAPNAPTAATVQTAPTTEPVAIIEPEPVATPPSAEMIAMSDPLMRRKLLRRP